MSIANSWFARKSLQNATTKVAELPVYAAIGPNIQPVIEREKDVKSFKVGKSVVGDGEVVG